MANKILKLGIPKGSLQESTFAMFKKAGFKIIILSRRGGFFSIKAQINTRYLIDKFNLYSHKYGRVLSPFFRAYSEFMFFLDKIDQSQANKKFALGWCIIAKK